MLVLARKNGQSIQIGDNIEIHIYEHNTSRVKVGIIAPEGVKILRSEIVNKPPRKEKK